MANDDLWNESGSPQNEGGSNLRKKKMLFAKNILETTRIWRPNLTDRRLKKKLKHQESLGSLGSQESQESQESYLATRSPPARSVRAVPLESAYVSDLTLDAETMNSSSSLELKQKFTRNVEDGEAKEGAGDPPTYSGVINIATTDDAQRAPSPRAQLESHSAEFHLRSSTIDLGPLDRYLGQDDISSDFDDGKELVGEEWTRLRSLRANVLRLRAHVRTKRKEIHARQQIKENADEAFMRYVREHRAASSMHSSLFPGESIDADFDALYEAMQAARDECGPLEHEFDISENHLDEAEFELAELERRLYKTHPDQNGSQRELSILPPPPESLFGLQSSSTPRYKPSHYDYLSRLGDLDLALERHQNLVQERDDLLSMQQSLVLVGLDLSEQRADFLDKFEGTEAALQVEILDIQQDVDRLRELCLAEGIDLDEGSSGYESESSTEQSDIVLGEKSITEPSMFPLLLPASVEGKCKLRVLITDFDEGNKSDRINQWIRHQLQNSLPEVQLLLRIFNQVLDALGFVEWHVNVFLWQQDVLFHWVRDEGNKSVDVFNNLQSRSSFTASHTSVTLRQRALPKMLGVQNSRRMPLFKHQRTQSAPASFDLAEIVKEPLITHVLI